MVAKAIDLVTYGAGEGIYYCLNAMATLFSGGRFSYIGSIMLITSMIALAIAIYRMVLEQNLQVPARWLLANSLLFIAATVPKVEVMVIDRVTGFHFPVANVPWLFAVPAGTISQIGDSVAKQIDNTFTVAAPAKTPTTLRQVLTAERKSVAMYSKLVANASNFDFVSHGMANNMREFVKECVYYDIAMQKYSVDDLKNTDDLWGLVSERASPLGGVIYKDSKQAPVEFLTCKEAAAKIKKAWPDEIKKAYHFYGKKLFPFGSKLANADPSTLLRKNLGSAYDYLTGVSKSADAIMQQNIMRNAVQDGFLTRAQEDGATASIQSYATARAEAYQQSVYNTQGGIATKAISYMKIVIEIIFYAMFPFVMIMVVFPHGQMMLKTYFTGLLWLQTWAPLYSILNMIIAVYCTENTFSAATTLNDPALTYDTIPALGEAAQAVSSYANYAMMSVPFLSWGLLKYGGGAMAQLSTTLSQPTQSASGMAAQEATSGNFSMGVRNFDSTSRHNINSFKQDENLSVASGSTSFQASDGAILRVTSDGTRVIDKNATISKLGVGLTDRNEISSSMNEMSFKAYARAQDESSSFGKSVNGMFDLMKNYSDSRGENASHDASIGSEQGLGMNEAINRVNNIVKSFAKSTGLSENEARLRLHAWSIGGGLNGGVSGQKGIPAGGLSLNAKGEATAQAGYNYNRNYSNTDSKESGTTSRDEWQIAQDYKEAMDKVTRISESEAFRNSGTEAASLSDGLSSKLSEARSYQQNVQDSLKESESWQQAANLVKTSSTGVVEDLVQDFVNYGVQQSDNNGYELRLDGLNNAMNDPVRRAELIEGFMQFRQDKILAQYANNEITNKSRINENYSAAVLNSQHEQDVKEFYAENVSKVDEQAAKNNLNKPLDQSGKNELQNKLNIGNETFNEKASDIKKQGENVKESVEEYNRNHPKGAADSKKQDESLE